MGVDGTEYGFEALRQTLVLAPPEATISAVTAVDTRPAARTGFDAAYWEDVLEREAAAARKGAAAILDDRGHCTALVVEGDAVQALRSACDEADATLLALGGRLSSRFLGIMLGDTANELLHDGACSVLVARPGGERWDIHWLVVGVDGSSSSLAALEEADEIAQRRGAAVQVVHARDGEEIEPGAWMERVDVWDPAHPVAALVGRSRNADLLVVGSRGLRGLAALESVSERVAHRASCSVLVVHEPA